MFTNEIVTEIAIDIGLLGLSDFYILFCYWLKPKTIPKQPPNNKAVTVKVKNFRI